ncbi:sodium/glucose cotransporter [Dokdonia pacifica]|uniref:Na+/proline symporter n=1 Tax=Dokdonia pacifica TaxID=1627892 RepID=A0A239A750_9FLAO|nr:sodium:solute symporter family protein [Dokdonia pacifica]GGG35273.1 sodium/glucose cotransporter [Dokdonia pacifica]SNR91329.1 Na+/proline symporter [Dokdonia pacifica]
MIDLSTLDLVIIISLFVIILSVGFYVSRTSGKDTSQYFLSGRNMPWWLLGLSMVATTFSTDTPNLVTNIVRVNGVAGNWVWWAFLITGLLTVFVYARLWRKSNVKTDIEFYELRYGGAPARFLRWFRAVFLGIFFNMFAMAGVMLAAIKIGEVMLGLDGWITILIAGSITLLFSSVGGFKGVVYTDFILFFVAMIGALGAAVYIVGLPEVGGLEALVSHPNVADKLSFIPDSDQSGVNRKELLITLFIIPIAVQWWSSWYPGGEPGGGGYVAQRMLAAKDENHAIGATFFFNFMHIAIRPWPWILVALASLIIFPDLASIQEAFPNVSDDKIGHDLAYPAMLTKLPSGLLGIVLASLAAAFMSTISTHLNWGASYLVNDLYKTQIKKEASEKEQVQAGRVATIILMVISALMALAMNNALQLFNIIIMFGAGTGLIFILRWFWWRINAWTEISAMLASGTISMLLTFTPLGEIMFGDTGWMPTYYQFPFIVVTTSIIWLIVTYLTQPESQETLARFYQKTTPGGKGWKKIVAQMTPEQQEASQTPWIVPQGILAMLLGCAFVYGSLFSTGYFIYGETTNALITLAIVIISGVLLLNVWKRMKKITDEST